MDCRITEKPPSSNTGVLSTQISLDYLSFTIAWSVQNLGKVREFFDAGDFTELSYGGMGYLNSAAILDGGRVFWHIGRPEMGIHIRLNPKSLSMVDTTPLGLLNRVFDWGGKITRLDIAFDDLDGILDVDLMYEKLLKGEVVTRWRRVSRITGQAIGKTKKIGDTVNVGGRLSEAFLRIYDKKMEREARLGHKIEADHWVRVELELKKDKANAFGKRLANSALLPRNQNAGRLCSKLLLGMIDFKDTDQHDLNKSRWETSDFWGKFVMVTSKLTLSIVKEEKTLDDSKDWIAKIVSPTLAMIMLSSSDDNGLSGYDFIMTTITDGADRLTKSQQTRLNLYNQEQETKQEQSPKVKH